MPTKLELAKLARQACEDYVRAQNPPKIKENLDGLCAIASALLVDVFREYGYLAHLVYGICHASEHCWVESEGERWDLTYTQFDSTAPVVYVTPTTETAIYLPDKTFVDLNNDYFRAEFSKWTCKEQRPFDDNLRRIRKYWPRAA